MQLPKPIKNLALSHSTPFYAYSGSQIKIAFEKLKFCLPPEFEIYYSAKANPHPKVGEALKIFGAGIDVTSLNELQMALKVGFDSQKISFVGPGKSLSEIEAAVKHNVTLVVESLDELNIYLEKSEQNLKQPKFLLRINPPEHLGLRGQRIFENPSQFGFDDSSLKETLELIQTNNLKGLLGFHFHLSSGHLNAEVVLKNFESFLDLSLKLKKKYSLDLKVINFGGGIGFPDYPGQNAIDLDTLQKGLKELVNSENFELLNHPKLIIESGRFLLRECGYYLTRVIAKKNSYGKVYVIVDGGFHQHMAASGFGYFPRRHFPIFALKDSSETEVVSVSGKTCFQLDLLAEDVQLPKLQPGDMLCILNSGAYGYSFSPLHFLSHSLPDEIFVE